MLERWGIVLDDGTAEAVMRPLGDGEGHSGAAGEPVPARPPASALQVGRRGTPGAPRHALMLRFGSEPAGQESGGLRLSAGGVAMELR